MALNFEGLGIGIEVEDNDAEEKVSGISDSMDDLWKSVKATANNIGMAGQKINKGLGKIGTVGKSALGGVAAAIGGIAQKAMDPELDHGLSGMYASFDKSFSQMTMGLKETEKGWGDAKRAIGSAAYGLNEDMDAAAQSWVSFKEKGVDLVEVMGAKNLKGAMKDLIRITATTGVEGEQLANIYGGLKEGFKFTNKEAGLLGDKVFAVGQHFDLGGKAIQAWPAIMESVNEQAADFGRELSKEEVEKMTTSIVQLGGGLHKALGMDGASALETARNAFIALSGERRGAIDMFRGMGDDFGELTKQVFEFSGGTGDMFDVLKSGDPTEMMNMLSKMADQARKSGGEQGQSFQRLRKIVTDTLGADVTHALGENWGKVQGLLGEVPKVIAGSEGALKKAAKAHHKTGLTAGDAWQRTLDGMKARMFKFSQKDVKEWAGNMRQGFDRTMGVLEKLSGDKGPVGELTRKMLLVQRVGLSGLLPSLGGLAPVFGDIAQSAMPALTAMGSMGLSFGSLGKMAMGGGALFGVFQLLKKGPKQAIADLKELGSTMWTALGELFPEMKKQAEDFFEYVKSGELLQDIGNLLSKIDVDEVISVVSDMAGAVGDMFVSVMKKIDWGKVIGIAFDLIVKAAVGVGSLVVALFGGEKGIDEAGEPIKAGVGGMLVDVISGLPAMLGKAARKMWESIFTGESLQENLGRLSKVLLVGLGALTVASKKFRGKLKDIFFGQKGVCPDGVMPQCDMPGAGGKGGLLGKARGLGGRMRGGMGRMRAGAGAAFRGAGGGMRGMLAMGGAGMRGMGRGIKGMGRGIAKGFGAAKSFMGPMVAFAGIASALNQVQIRSESISKIMKSDVVPEMEKAGLAGEQAFLGFGNVLDSMFMGLPSLVGGALGVTSKDLTHFYFDMVAGFESAIAETIGFFVNLGTRAGYVWDSILGAAESMISGIITGVANFGGEVEKVFWEIVTEGKKIFSTLTFHLMYPFRWLAHELKGWISKFLDDVLLPIASRVPGFSDKIIDGMEKTSTKLKKEYKQEEGKHGFYEEQKKKLKQNHKEIEDEMDQHTARIDAEQARRNEQQAQKDQALADKQSKLKKDADKAIAQQGKKTKRQVEDSWGAAQKSAEGSIALSAAGGPGAGKGGSADKSAEEEKRRKKRRAPTVAERVDMATPKDRESRSFMHQMTALNSTMNEFFKKPFELKLNVAGDVGKFMKFQQQQERKGAPRI